MAKVRFIFEPKAWQGCGTQLRCLDTRLHALRIQYMLHVCLRLFNSDSIRVSQLASRVTCASDGWSKCIRLGATHGFDLLCAIQAYDLIDSSWNIMGAYADVQDKAKAVSSC
jgi:hypothetical protein